MSWLTLTSRRDNFLPFVFYYMYQLFLAGPVSSQSGTNREPADVIASKLATRLLCGCGRMVRVPWASVSPQPRAAVRSHLSLAVTQAPHSTGHSSHVYIDLDIDVGHISGTVRTHKITPPVVAVHTYT
jgi:hypothetical protein